MSCMIEMLNDGALDPSYIVQWGDNGVASGDPLDISTCRFVYRDDPQAITVDIGATTVYVDRANRPGALLGFERQCALIRADNMPGVAPVHLLFDVPVSAVGAHVSAVVPDPNALGKVYHAQLTVGFEGEWRRQTVSLPFRLSNTVGTAPFLAAQIVPPSPRITDVWFDVLGDTHVTPPPIQVAVNELRFLE